MKRRTITVEIDIPGGDPDYTHFVETADPYDVLGHGTVVHDEILTETTEEQGHE